MACKVTSYFYKPPLPQLNVELVSYTNSCFEVVHNFELEKRGDEVGFVNVH
jgi:hypothetical protein